MSAVLDDSVGFEEPATETAPTTDRNAVVIAQDLTRVQSALSEFDRVSAGLAELEARFPKDAVYDVSTPKGMKDAIEHRAAYRDPRVMVEKARKMAKAPILALGKNVDARAAWITERLEAGETPVHEQIKAEEARKAQEKADREAKEFGRVLAIQEALAAISQDVLIASSKTSADINALLETMRTTEPAQTVFQEMLDQAKAAWSAGIGKLETALKAKLWDEEQEATRVAAEAERKRQQAAEDAERARIAAEQAAEAKRLKEAAEQLAAEREEIARQMAALKAAQAPAPVLPPAEPDTPPQSSQQVLKAEAETPDATDRDAPAISSPSVGSMGAGQPADAGPACEADNSPPIKLGDINARLAPIQISADGLAQLGFTHVATDRAAKLYRAADFALICDAISALATRAKDGEP